MKGHLSATHNAPQRWLDKHFPSATTPLGMGEEKERISLIHTASQSGGNMGELVGEGQRGAKITPERCLAGGAVTRRLVIYAHYDSEGEIKPYVLRTLRDMKPFCSEIHFVSTATLSSSEQEKLKDLCITVRLKANIGLDFGMWQMGIQEIDLSAWDELLLLNSSVCSMGPVEPLFRAAAGQPWDFWGLTDTLELDWHLQSYFLVFRASVLRSEAFSIFWNSVIPYQDKDQIIRSYELGVSLWLKDAGFRPGVLFPYEHVRKYGKRRWLRFGRVKRKTNPCIFYAENLLWMGMPFVKTALLRDYFPGVDPERIGGH